MRAATGEEAAGRNFYTSSMYEMCEYSIGGRRLDSLSLVVSAISFIFSLRVFLSPWSKLLCCEAQKMMRAGTIAAAWMLDPLCVSSCKSSIFVCITIRHKFWKEGGSARI
jgi:hypothetical protein